MPIAWGHFCHTQGQGGPAFRIGKGAELDKEAYIRVIAQVDRLPESHGINEVWLRTGETEPFSKTPDEDAIISALAQAMGGNPSSAKDRLIRAIARMPESYFPAIEQMLYALVENLEAQSKPPKE